VSDEQHPPIGAHPGEQVERLGSVEVSAERRMHRQQLLLLGRPALAGQLSGLARAYLGAEHDHLELGAHAADRAARGPRLGGAALGQPALGILAGAMRLGLCVTK